MKEIWLKTWQIKDGEIVYQNGTFVWLYNENALKQRLENRLKLWRGEFQPEPQEGTRWKEIFQGEDITNADIERILKEDIEKDKYIKQVASIAADYDTEKRAVNVTFEAIGTKGDRIELKDIEVGV
jgi:hypothetical protein